MRQDDTTVLVDTSPDLRAQLLRNPVRRIDAILFTHAHADHTAGLDELRLVAADQPPAGGALPRPVERLAECVVGPHPGWQAGAGHRLARAPATVHTENHHGNHKGVLPMSIDSSTESVAASPTSRDAQYDLVVRGQRILTTAGIVAREVGIEGRLGGQARVPGAAGLWRDLTDNVNQLAANLTNQVRSIADVATAVTKGDLTRSIAVEASGEMAALKDKHPSFGDARAIGLFGIVEVRKNSKGEPMAPYNGNSEGMQKLAKFFKDEGLFTFVRWNTFMCNPPLMINETQLKEGFAIIDRGLEITDKYFEG